MNKRILSITLVLAMLVGMFTIVPMTVSADTNSNVWDGTTATSFAGGDGTENNPYQISNGAELALMSKLITVDNNGNYNRACYKLTADIVLNDMPHVSTWYGAWNNDEYEPENMFTPIGTWSNATSSFGGIFDGDGHTITGAYFYSESGDNHGLFGAVQGGAVIKNFALVNSLFGNKGGNIAAIAGTTDRSNGGNILVENVYVDAYVYSGGSNAGGIFGTLSNTQDGYTAGTVTLNRVTFVGKVEGANYASGLIADSRSVVFDVRDCLVYATIYARNSSGYAAGFVSRSNNTLSVLGSAYKQKVTNCIFAGVSVGASSGSNTRTFVSTSKNTNTIGAYYCYTPISSPGTMKNSDTFDDAPSYNDIANSELYGSHEGSTKIEWDVLSSWTRPLYDIARPAGIAENFAINPVEPPKQFANGNGTEADPYEIANAEDLANLANLVNNNFENGAYRTAYYELTANITLTGENNHAPIGTWNFAFGGNFNGNGYTISGLHISTTADGQGLFGVVQGGAVIKNLAVVDAYISSSGATGAIVGQTNRANDGAITIDNVYVDAEIVSGGSEVGGIIGNISGASGSYVPGEVCISNAVFNGTVKAKSWCAGILGNGRDASVEITNSMNLGTIVATNGSAAGIFASSVASSVVCGDFVIENCVSAGNVIATANAKAFYYGNVAMGEEDARDVVTSVYVAGIAKDGAVGNANADATAVANISKLFGNNATVPATFTKKAGDIAVPAGCTVAPASLIGLNMVSGAAVRMANPTGLRFTAVIGADYLNALVGDATDYSYGIIIAPTDYIAEANGVFTVEALKALSYTVSYKEIKAEKLQNDPTADGCYVFTGTLVNVQEANYTRDFSAIAYVKVGDTYYYSSYSEELNSRNIAEVASNACADTSAEQNEVYQYAVTEAEVTVYSPYTEEQRKVLADFFQ